MSKPIYKPSKPYTEDINDLVEKGGVGSGIKGHRPTAGDTIVNSSSEEHKGQKVMVHEGSQGWFMGAVKVDKHKMHTKWFETKEEASKAIKNKLDRHLKEFKPKG